MIDCPASDHREFLDKEYGERDKHALDKLLDKKRRQRYLSTGVKNTFVALAGRFYKTINQ